MNNAERKITIQGLKFLALILSFTFCALSFTVSCAQPISSSELIKNAKDYDGKTVLYGGEVIGDIMRRGDFAWINVNDGQNAIGVWIDASMLKEITYTGSYRSKGDVVDIAGEFHRACPEHGGDLDIHARALQKKIDGGMIVQKFNPDKRNLIIILLGLLATLWILSLLKRK